MKKVTISKREEGIESSKIKGKTEEKLRCRVLEGGGEKNVGSGSTVQPVKVKRTRGLKERLSKRKAAGGTNHERRKLKRENAWEWKGGREEVTIQSKVERNVKGATK